MGLGFDAIPDRQGYLRTAGVQQDAKFVGLTYNWTENYEYFDIEIETADGRMFRERTFGPNIDKSFPRTKYEKGKAVGTETKEEAYQRSQDEVSRKLYDLASCFVHKDELKERVKNCKDLKDMVGKVNAAIGPVANLPHINFLTIWKNSDSKQRSNLIIADKTKWCEPTQYGANGQPMPTNIKLTQFQMNNNMTEKYPYKGENAAEGTESTIEAGAQYASDLPF